MRLLDEWMRKWRKISAQKSHLCDACGAEVFSYPTPRVCDECRAALLYNDEHSCFKCGRPTEGEGVCGACKQFLPTFEKGASAFAYFDKSASVVNAYKNGKRYLQYWFAEELQKVLPRLPAKDYVLVAVPLTKEKLRVRGYNQSKELVDSLAELTGYERHTSLLERRRSNEQKQLSLRERRKNIAGVFRVTDKKYCKGKDFLIVDDILTTGATLSELSSLLLRAGANSVCVLTVAAVPDRSVEGDEPEKRDEKKPKILA
jgi:competence protein ComFC